MTRIEKHFPEIHTADELPADDRAVIEKYLGRPLEAKERFQIHSLLGRPAPRGPAREAAWRRLEASMDRMAEQSSLTDAELKEILGDS